MSFGRDIAAGLAGLIVGLAVICFALGGLVVWGIPILWHWLKPIIHGLTQ